MSKVLWENVGPTDASYEWNMNTVHANGRDNHRHVQDFNVHSSGRVASILQDPIQPNTIYVASALGGMWKTDNFFAKTPTWKPISSQLITTSIGSAALGGDPKRVYLATGDGYPGSSSSLPGTDLGGYVCSSSDGGATWNTTCAKLQGAYMTRFECSTNHSSGRTS